MAEPMAVSGMVVTMHYTLRDDDGKIIDTSTHGAPMAYLHGHSNIVPGLERELEGKTVGDKVQVVVAPADGYGERHGPGPQAVPRKEFPKGMNLREGMPMRAQGSSGEPIVLYITKVQGAKVWVDVNHPLAGKNLHFDVEIMDIRGATPEELQHGHAHGDGGHHH